MPDDARRIPSATVALGAGVNLQLKHALLVYYDNDSRRPFTSLHAVALNRDGTPRLLAGRPPSASFAAKLAKDLLGVQTKPTWLDEHVVASGWESVAWWRPASRRVLHLQTSVPEINALSGRTFPIPPLLFRLDPHGFSVRALRENRRPAPDDNIAVAPFLNTNAAAGNICMGSAPRPKGSGAAVLEAWEMSFWNSAFTHGFGAETTYPGGFTALLLETVDAESFPMEHLGDAKQTAGDFVANRERLT